MRRPEIAIIHNLITVGIIRTYCGALKESYVEPSKHRHFAF